MIYQAAFQSGDYLLSLVQVESETVTGLEMLSGHVHRGIAYLTAKRNIYQNLGLLEHVCSLCSNSHPETYDMALETIAGIAIPINPGASFINPAA